MSGSVVVGDPLPELVSASGPGLWAALSGAEDLAFAVPLALLVGHLAVCWLRPHWLLRLFLRLLTHSRSRWGGLFGPPGGPVRWRRPLEVPYTVSVAFGRPLPAATPAAEVVLAVQKLSADSAIERNAGRRPVHRQFVRMAARGPFRPCFSDS